MSFGITKTIPAERGQAAVDALYDGSAVLDRQSLFSYAGRKVTTTDALQHSTERYYSVLGQLLPGSGVTRDHDGFFFASIRKRP